MYLPLIKSQKHVNILQSSIFMNDDFHEREELFTVLNEGHIKNG